MIEFINTLGGMEMEHGRSAKKKNSAELSGASAVIRSGFIGAGVAALLSVVLLFVATLIAYSTEDPDSMTGALGLAASCISAMAAGFCSVRINRQSALVCGAFSGFLLAFFFFLISLFFDASAASGLPIFATLGLRGAMIVMSVLGAYAGLHRGAGKRRKKPRR